ncbi:hypothetical protein Bpla01_25320 [Burkholderia plantarii]|nr:hypothetical protein Bpla01_25320 [Burkholderia plantarii]
MRWYHRFNLSLRDIEELLLERGVEVTYGSVRNWCDRFGAQFAHCAKAVRPRPGTTWHLDELFVNCEASRMRCGARWMSTAWSSTCCYRNVATRQPRNAS